MHERTLVLIKPDACRRGLAGAILTRFEMRGLCIDDIRLSSGEAGIIGEHYGQDPAWLRAIGAKTLNDYTVTGQDPVAALGTADPEAIGRQVRGWLLDFMLSGPVIAVAITGNRAVEAVRATVGATLPVAAAAGTIRGDYSCDSADLANHEERAVANLVHASGSRDEAVRELRLWFPVVGHDQDGSSEQAWRSAARPLREERRQRVGRASRRGLFP
jgi:nucleoside-diphosphate kinase